MPDGAHAAAPGSFDVYTRHMCATSIWVRRLVGPAEPTLLWCGPAARRSRKPRSRARNNRRRSARCIRCDGWVHGTLSQAEKAPDTMLGERHQVADGTVGRRKYFFLLAIVKTSDGSDTSLTHLCDHRLCHTSASYACRVTKRPLMFITSVDMTSPLPTGLRGVHSGLIPAVVGASNVESSDFRDVYPSYVSIRDPWWRGTGRRRP